MRALWIFLMATTVATPVLAADMARKAPAVPPVESIVRTWTGFYAGAQFGYDFGHSSSKDQNAISGATDWWGGYDVNGVFGGIFAGYNYQIANYVLGVEADVSASGARGSMQSVFAGNMRTTVPVDGSIRARLGYAFDDVLIYGTGGIAFAQFENRYEELGVVDKRTSSRVGWTLGAGAEYAFAPNWTVRAEYRYTDFGEKTDDNVATDLGWNYPNKTHLHSIRAGVAYRF